MCKFFLRSFREAAKVENGSGVRRQPFGNPARDAGDQGRRAVVRACDREIARVWVEHEGKVNARDGSRGDRPSVSTEGYGYE